MARRSSNEGRPRKRPDLAARNRERSKHGMSNTPTWLTWKVMRDRVTKKADKDYPRYGGRGIDIDPRWMEFNAFFSDMGERPSGKTLGRIDNERGYWPDNCRWETPLEQANNNRSNRIITVGDCRMTIARAAAMLGMSRQALRHRVNAGWRADELSMPINHGNGWKRGERRGN